MKFLSKLFGTQGNQREVEPSSHNTTEELTECNKCGCSTFSYDRYFNEYICEDCGWTILERPNCNIKESPLKKKLPIKKETKKSAPQKDPGPSSIDLANKKQKKKERIAKKYCGNCSRTSNEILAEFDRMSAIGVKVIGSGDGLLYCDTCNEQFCGDCQVDLGWDSGCPRCRKALD